MRCLNLCEAICMAMGFSLKQEASARNKQPGSLCAGQMDSRTGALSVSMFALAWAQRAPQQLRAAWVPGKGEYSIPWKVA